MTAARQQTESTLKVTRPKRQNLKRARPEYVKLNNQFVVPVVEDGRVAAMVVLSLSLEVEAGNTEAVYQREPKLRDAFLQVLFDHANVGGFCGSFTDGVEPGRAAHQPERGRRASAGHSRDAMC